VIRGELQGGSGRRPLADKVMAGVLGKKRDKAIFMDRDGTIIEDVPYLANHEKVKLIAGVGECLAELQRQGYKLILISNQSGVGRGLIAAHELEKIHERLESLLAIHGVDLTSYHYCLHTPQDKCECRKPMPGMILDAIREFDLDIENSFMIGDKESDLLAGRNAGCRTIHIAFTDNEDVDLQYADFRAKDWWDIKRYILGTTDG
jgi:D-glycero-D-manno-heptose 1,7-bisphosphate phosphatase